jgi:hypothetical protein
VIPSALNALNDRLGIDLGRVASGTLPRFAWKHASDMPMVSQRVGNRWMLTEWRRPSMTPEQWAKNCPSGKPYPAAGWYHPYLETALPIGMEPTLELTVKAISQFRRQMDTSYENQMRRENDEIRRERGYVPDGAGYRRLDPHEDDSEDRRQWVDRIQNSDPRFSQPNPVTNVSAFPQFMGKKASEGFVGI